MCGTTPSPPTTLHAPRHALPYNGCDTRTRRRPALDCHGRRPRRLQTRSAITSDLANYIGTSTYAQGQPGQYREETTPVGSFGIANNFGLYDMHGNVWEWCTDSWHSNYRGAPSTGQSWQGDSRYRVVRGGSWLGSPISCRSACRNFYAPSSRYIYIGFRVVTAV